VRQFHVWRIFPYVGKLNLKIRSGIMAVSLDTRMIRFNQQADEIHEEQVPCWMWMRVRFSETGEIKTFAFPWYYKNQFLALGEGTETDYMTLLNSMTFALRTIFEQQSSVDGNRINALWLGPIDSISEDDYVILT
jgi:hypothetical protein